MEQQSDQNAENQKHEEFPIEEFDGVDDWNARAWERIQRQEKLATSLAGYPFSKLGTAHKYLISTEQDEELQSAIAAEIKRRTNDEPASND